MALDRLDTPYGTPALQALRAAVDRVQQGDPLSPVTVLVHSNAVGVAARRWLAAHGGVAAAQFLTPFRFAELLGGPALVAGGRRPVSTPVVDVAVRTVLARSTGLFAPIAHHQATIAAVRTAHHELRHLPTSAVRQLATRGSARARELVQLHRAVQRLLQAEWYDEADLLRAACDAAAHASPRTIVFLPQRVRATEQALLDALAAHGTVTVIHGDDAAPSTPVVQLVDTSDADEEAREAVRTVAAAVHDGMPLHRISIVWPRTDPYARLVTEHLVEAGITWNGRAGIALHERLAARLVLDVLRLDRRGIRRADLFALLAHVPARLPDGTRVPKQLWERLARDAGLAGDADWNGRLGAYHQRLLDDDRTREALAAQQLAAFVADLRALLGPADQPRPWSHWAGTADTLLDRWLGGARGLRRLPPDELDAHARVQAALDRLARLDALAPPTTRDIFAHTLEAELDGAPGRVGRIGVGVHVGPLSFAVGQQFDLMMVVGACEGFLPAPPPAEALLTDGDRALTDGALPVAADLVADQRRQLWAALAGAERAVLCMPRGDLRSTALRQPSRWIAELQASTPASTQWSTRSVPSFAAGLADTAFPATAAQHRIRALAHAARAGRRTSEHPLVAQVPALHAGAAMLHARALPVLTEYDGDLSGLHIDPLGDRPVSPTRLEAWAACPHGWFMRYVLDLLEVEQPDEQLQITPRDRGTLVHATLDRFHRAVLDGSLPQPGPDGWGPHHLEALLDAFTVEAARLEAEGTVGRVAFWRSEQSRQRHELEEWLRHDSELVAARHATVIASERRFGFDTETPPAVIELPDGRQVRLRGAIDRIDQRADGSLVVTDHKTGSARSFKGITDVDPTAGGTKVQLPAYAAAAIAIAGAPAHTAVTAEYAFMASERFARVSATIGPEGWTTVHHTLARILDGIEAGIFVALPDSSQFRRTWVTCPYCDPDGLGTVERYAEFERKRDDPRLVALFGEAAAEADHD